MSEKVVQTGFQGWSGGTRWIPCPSCGKPLVWSAANKPTTKVTCNQDQGRDEQKCTYTALTSDLNYLWDRERRRRGTESR